MKKSIITVITLSTIITIAAAMILHQIDTKSIENKVAADKIALKGMH